MPSPLSKNGRKCYVTPAFSVAQKRAEMLCHPWGAVKGAPMDTCFRRHESLVYSASWLLPENVQVPGELAPGEPEQGSWLPRSLRDCLPRSRRDWLPWRWSRGGSCQGGQFTAYASRHVHSSLPARHARSGPPHPCSLSHCPLRHVPGWHQAHLSRSERQHHKRLMSVALMSMQRSWILGAPLHPVPHWAFHQHSHLGKGHVLPRSGLHSG